MSKSTQATKQAAQQAKKIRKAVSDNLVELEEKAPQRANPKELNQKINKIDTDIDSLRSELSTTNKGLKTSLSSLVDKDLDLTSRVSQAYQKLGEMDDSYHSLTDKSANISRDIKSITKTINALSQKTDEEIGGLSDSYLALIAKTEELTHKSKLTSQNLNKSIKANAQAMKEVEEKLLSEIDGVDKSSQSRDDSLNETTNGLQKELHKAEDEIRASQARLLKMQAVDQALEKRAEALETTTGELTKKGRDLARSTTLLNKRTGELNDAIIALQATSEAHQEMIVDLQEKSEKTSRALVAAIMHEKRHFVTLGAGLGLILLALIGYMFYQGANWSNEAENNASLQAGMNELNTSLTQVDGRVSDLHGKMASGDEHLQSEITAINHKLTHMGDQVDSLDGRVNNIRPHRSFGIGNVIHGPEWIAAQSSNQFSIHLATLSDKPTLYKLAERYSHYLKDDLAYLPVEIDGKQGFALILGRFDSENSASAALSGLPRYIERQRPVVYQIKTIQNYLTDNR